MFQPVDCVTPTDSFSSSLALAGASTATVAATCAMMMTHSLINYLHGKTNMPTRTIFYYDNFDCDKWEMAPEKECVFCNDPCIINNAPVANT
jgi:hypothetical protein